MLTLAVNGTAPIGDTLGEVEHDGAPITASCCRGVFAHRRAQPEERIQIQIPHKPQAAVEGGGGEHGAEEDGDAEEEGIVAGHAATRPL